MKKNVLLAGLFHETHTFLPGTTGVDDFALTEGKQLFDKRGDGSPLDGFLESAERHQWNVLPLLDLRAAPSATVEDACFEDYWSRFSRALDGYREACWDGLFLVLHGAMCTQSIPDVEGELLRRIRAHHRLSGVPVFGVLDLHANVTPAMARHANALVAYRRNPHTDARETAVRAAAMLARSFMTNRVPRMEYLHGSVLLSPLATGTDDDPMKWLLRFSELLKSHHPDVWEINVASGYAYADTPATGLSFSAVYEGHTQEAKSLLHELKKEAWRLRDSAHRELLTADAVFGDFHPDPKGPTVFIESSDNIGGGTWGDATGALRALLKAGIGGAAVVINDPEAVRSLENRPPGTRCTMPVGGKRNPFDEGPVEVSGVLRHRSDGVFQLEDPRSHLASMYGNRIDMGPCAVLETDIGLKILLTSRPTPPFDLGQLRSQGIEPESLAAVVVKAAVGHRQAWDPIAARSIQIDTPGPCPADISRLPYAKLSRPIYPLSAEIQPSFKHHDSVSSQR